MNGIIEGNEFEKSAPASKTDSRMWVAMPLDMDGHGCHYEYYECSQCYLVYMLGFTFTLDLVAIFFT